MIEYKKILELIGKYLPNPQAIQLNQWIDQLRKENNNLRDEINALKREVEELSSQTNRDSDCLLLTN